MCQVCEGGEPTIQCLDCQKISVYCKSCFDYSHKSDARRLHRFKVLSAAKASETQGLAFCSVHGDQLLKYFCKTCYFTVCSDCIAVGGHKEHKAVPLAEAAEDLLGLYDRVIAEHTEARAALEKCGEKHKALAEEHKKRAGEINSIAISVYESVLGAIAFKKREVTKWFDDLEIALQFKFEGTKQELMKRCGVPEVLGRDHALGEEIGCMKERCQDSISALQVQLKALKRVEAEGELRKFLENSSLSFPNAGAIQKRLGEIMDSHGEVVVPEINPARLMRMVSETRLSVDPAEILGMFSAVCLPSGELSQSQTTTLVFPKSLCIYDPQRECSRTVSIDKCYGLTEFQIASASNNMLYLSGGQDMQGNVQRDLIGIVLGTLKVQMVVQLEPMQIGRSRHGSAVVTFSGGRGLYVACGNNEKNEAMAECEKYDIESNRWFAAPGYGSKCSDLSLCAMGESLFGFSGDLNSVKVLQPLRESEGWKELGPLFALGWPKFSGMIAAPLAQDAVILFGIGRKYWTWDTRIMTTSEEREGKGEDTMDFSKCAVPRVVGEFLYVVDRKGQAYSYNTKTTEWHLAKMRKK